MLTFEEHLEQYNSTRRKEDLSSFCHAPSVNLNFEQTGNVTSCCFNRRLILGNYPKQSIHDIWTGERATEFRKLLKKNDLSKGCQLCRHQLEAGNYTGIRSRGFDHIIDGDSLMPMPKVMEFEISNVCNLECIMCNGYFSSSIRRNREQLEPMPKFYDDSFVEQLREFIPHLTDMKFLGGEPFLNPLYYKIWDLVYELNPEINVVITTNGTIYNNKVERVLKRLKPSITLSLDSLDAATYESIRINGDFSRVEENLHSFIEHYRNNPRKTQGMAITICPMPQNWRTIPDILNFCDREGLSLGVNTVVWPPECSIKHLPKKEIKKIHSFLSAHLPAESKNGIQWWKKSNRDAYDGMLNQIGSWGAEELAECRS